MKLIKIIDLLTYVAFWVLMFIVAYGIMVGVNTQ